MRKNNRGFTLIELLVYLSIFIVLITIITLFALTFIETVHKNQIKKEVVLGAHSAMRNILYEIKAAKSVYNPTSIFGFYPGQLSLRTTQDMPEGEQETYVDFYLDDNNKLYLKRENQPTQLIISEDLRVINLEFQYFASSSEAVMVDLTIGYNTANPEYQYFYTLNSAATIRK